MLSDLVIHASQTALQNAEYAFRRVAVNPSTAVLTDAVIHGVVGREPGIKSGVAGVLVGADVRGGIDVLFQNASQTLRRHSRNRKAANVTATLYHAHDRRFRFAGGAAHPPSLALATNVSFIAFDDAIQFLAKRRLAHRVANAMSHKPRSLVRHAEHPV